MDPKKALPLIDKFVSWASPKRVLMLGLMSFVLIFCWTVFEHRSGVAELFTDQEKNATPQELTIVLPDETKKKIEDFVKRHADVNVVTIVSANIRVNHRTMVYFFSDDTVMDTMMRTFTATRGATQPIFNNDEKNNTQMVSAINGEFGCYKYEETANVGLFGKSDGRIASVCRVSLPPYYGEFSGYLTVGLTRVPDGALTNEIRIEAVRLATDIYFKSIASKRQIRPNANPQPSN